MLRYLSLVHTNEISRQSQAQMPGTTHAQNQSSTNQAISAHAYAWRLCFCLSIFRRFEAILKKKYKQRAKDFGHRIWAFNSVKHRFTRILILYAVGHMVLLLLAIDLRSLVLATFQFDYEYEFDFEYDFLETFRFDYEYDFLDL